MVTISPEAVVKVEQFIAMAGTDPTDWFLIISWKKGAADVRRTGEGAVAWDRNPDEGWVVELGGWKPGKVPPDEGCPLFRDVRLLIEQRFAPELFPGGEIYVEAGEFKVRPHAI
jgi:hypothetical protein